MAAPSKRPATIEDVLAHPDRDRLELIGGEGSPPLRSAPRRPMARGLVDWQPRSTSTTRRRCTATTSSDGAASASRSGRAASRSNRDTASRTLGGRASIVRAIAWSVTPRDIADLRDFRLLELLGELTFIVAAPPQNCPASTAPPPDGTATGTTRSVGWSAPT